MVDMQSPPDLGDVVDVGSWARFSPSLAVFIDEQVRRRLPGGLGGGLTVMLTAPAPIVSDQDLVERGVLRSLWRRRPPRTASPDAPGVVLAGGDDGVEAGLPVLDAAGRVLLGDGACAQLTALGWARRAGRLTRLFQDGGAAAEAVTRVLIEVLRVAHPADLDWLVTERA
ncbi:MAG: hypothetical protein DI576_08845 [Actinomyces sp.]|nr:MAG: hypothetical protein DI576_08845 [Actinomyces sp.]